MASRLQLPGDESVLLHVTHSNLKTFSAEVRCSLESTVEAVKDKLWKKCGTAVTSMCLELYDESGTKVSDLSDNTRPLGFYSPLDGYRLHVIDLDPSSVTSGGWLEDTSLVEKYKISDEAYDKLDADDEMLSLLTWKLSHWVMGSDSDCRLLLILASMNKPNKLLKIMISGAPASDKGTQRELITTKASTYRKFKEKLVPQTSSAQGSKTDDNYMEDICANIKVGDRCQVEPGEKRGVVKFVGRAEVLGPGFWVGIQYDEPLGKHDGLVKGTRFFKCPPLHGAMVRPDKVKVGDYPERDPFEEEEEEI